MIEDHEESQDEGLAKRPANANDTSAKESRKGKIPSEKISRKGKGSERPFKAGEILSSLRVKGQHHGLRDSVREPSLHHEVSKTTLAEDAEDTKHQLARITGSLASLTPVIAEIKYMTTIMIRQRKICQKVRLNLSLKHMRKLRMKISMSRQQKDVN